MSHFEYIQCQDPVIYDASVNRMQNMPAYSQSADANDVNVFHGREVRKVPNAAGGMGFVLQVSTYVRPAASILILI